MKLSRCVAAISLIAANLIFAPAHAQQAVRQSGPWAPSRAPMYSANGSSTPTLQDSGPAAGGPPGVGLSEQLLTIPGFNTTGPNANAGTGPYGTNWCDYDAPITSSGGYHYLCLSPNAQGGGLIAYGAGGGAAQLPLQANINGVLYTFPFALSGVLGPTTTTAGMIPTWANNTGTLLGTGVAIPPSGFGTVKGPASTTINNLVVWTSTDGTTVGTGSPVPITGIGNMTGTGPTVVGSVPVWSNTNGTGMNNSAATLLAGAPTFSLTIGGAPAMSFPATNFSGDPAYGPNTFVGYNAGINSGVGAIEVTAVGQRAGGGNGWANNNPGMGIGGGTGLLGVENTFTGWWAGTQMTTGQGNAAYGNAALGFEITGSFNTALGHDAMRNSKGATSGVSVGSNAGRNDSGTVNTFIGDSSGFGTDPALGQATTTTGGSNVGVGASTLYHLTTGNNNSAVGKGALFNLTTGSNNLALGQNVGGTTLTTGSSNIYLGTNQFCDAQAANESNTFRICSSTGYPTLMSGNLTGTALSLTLTGNFMQAGTPPVATGTCPLAFRSNGANGGTFTLNGACSGGTVIYTFLTAAPTGWACATQAINGGTDTIRQSGFTGTTATFTVTGANGDFFTAICTGV